MYKILIVEDEKWIRMGIRTMIDTNINPISEIIAAEDGAEGVKLWCQKRPEIVISDVKMPNKDGCEMCEEIYAINPETEFIIISGHNEFDYARRSLGFRAKDYLLKPINKEVLNNLITSCVQNIAQRKGETKIIEQLKKSGMQRSENDIISEVTLFINDHYNEKLDLPQLAKNVYISEAYMSSLFKKTLGLGPIQYITNVRIEHAVRLLENTNEKILDIANMVGYHDQTYFTKVFRRVTGKNPSEYKQKKEE